MLCCHVVHRSRTIGGELRLHNRLHSLECFQNALVLINLIAFVLYILHSCAGERLGFLPGDLQNKVDPYLRPLYDALFDMLGAETFQKYQERGSIEVAPLAYMRGRTLDDSFIILDEAQNTTPEQMKMFLTRMGFNSKAVVTGDITQTDLPSGTRSGLVEAMNILRGIEDIAIHEFSEKDVVRHKLVQKIILAYDKYERERKEKNDRYRVVKKDSSGKDFK